MEVNGLFLFEFGECFYDFRELRLNLIDLMFWSSEKEELIDSVFGFERQHS